MQKWEETEEYRQWRKNFPKAAVEYDKAKQKEKDLEREIVTRIRKYKKNQYAEMTQVERKKHLKLMKKVYEKRKQEKNK